MIRDLEVEMLPVASLAPYAANARKHPAAQVAQIAASISEFGFNVPVLIDDAGVLIAGHGRVLAAKKIGLVTVPAIRLRHLTEAQARAFRLADNQLTINAEWDDALLRGEMEALHGIGFDLTLTGFSDSEIAAMLGAGTGGGLTDPDDTPAAPERPVSVLGDTWLLGAHRLVCGDATSADDVAKALAGVKPHLMVTDPPYGVEYDPSWRAEAGVNRNRGKLGKVENDDRADWREAWALFPGDVAYVWHAGLFAGVVADSLAACGFAIRSQIVWAKDRFALSRGHYHWQHEPCWYAVRKSATGHWHGDRSQSTLWQIPAREDSGVGHGTQKPVECMKRPIENNSSPGQAVYEPFSGSGTTIIAAEMTGRACHALELSPAYVDVAVKRWQAFTGQTATLDGDGRTFDEIATLRGAAEAA